MPSTKSSFLDSKRVPYVGPETPAAAMPFLPADSSSRLTLELVRKFKKASRRDPEISLVVLGTLRAHCVNGADAPLAGVSMAFSAMAIFSGLWIGSATGWLVLPTLAWGAAILGGALVILRVSFAAHARRVTATTWLGAYQDALRK